MLEGGRLFNAVGINAAEKVFGELETSKDSTVSIQLLSVSALVKDSVKFYGSGLRLGLSSASIIECVKNVTA